MWSFLQNCPPKPRPIGIGGALVGLLAVGWLGLRECAAAPAPEFVWARSVTNSGGTYGLGLTAALDSEGGLCVGGFSDGTTLDFGGVVLTNAGIDWRGVQFICKYDASGIPVWCRQVVTNPPWYMCLRLATDSLGNIYCAGRFKGPAVFGNNTLVSSTPADVFLAKYDTYGQVMWAKRIGANGSSLGLAVEPTGNAFLVARDSGTVDFGSFALTNSAAFIAKYDSAGNLVWARESVPSEAIAVGSNGAVCVTGTSGVLAKYDQFGSLVWSRAFPKGKAIALDQRENIFVTGLGAGTFDGITLTNSGGDIDAFVARCDPSGKVVWMHQPGGVQCEFGSGIALDGYNNVYVTSIAGTGNGEQGLTVGATVLTNACTFVAKYDCAGNALWGLAPITPGIAGIFCIAFAAPTRIYVAGGFSQFATFGGTTLVGEQSDLNRSIFAAMLGGDYDTPAATLDSVLSPATGRLQFNVTGATGLTYIVEGSTNLVDWIPLMSGAAPFPFTDSDAAAFPSRYYRAVCQP